MTALMDEAMVAGALEVARELARAGIPVFAAPPDPGQKVGFRLPANWQRTAPDPARVDEWQPGWALCMVCGHGLDGVDIDIYAGGMLDPVLDAGLPRVWASAATPSGGIHLLVRSLGVRSKNGLFQGVDVKSGEPGGKGHGFLFLAPTVKASKVTGEPASYAWTSATAGLREFLAGEDRSGHGLAQAVRRSRGGHEDDDGRQPRQAAPQQPGPVPTPEEFMRQAARTGPWQDVAGTLAREGRNDGIMRLAASLRETTGLSEDEAIAYLDQHAWPLIDQGQGGHEFPHEEMEEVVRAVWRQYQGGGDKVVLAATATADLATSPLPATLLELTEAYLTDRAAHVLWNRFCWARGLGWMKWDSQRWKPADEAEVVDDLRKYFKWLLETVTLQPGTDAALLGKLISLLTAAKAKAVTSLCRGHEKVIREPEDFDRHKDLLNTPAGVVSLRDGSVRPHDPLLLMTKVTSGCYRPGYRHPDWEQALTALDPEEREWLRCRMGQGITGYPSSDGIMIVLQGGGENGKSSLSTDGPVKALGGYADIASPKLVTQHRPGASEHSTEMADLRGQRLLIGEELSEGRSIDVTALKRIQDVGRIKARYVHKDNITFDASHTLMITTNYVPVIAETDHGTWRRLALLRFRYRFVKAGEELGPLDREGDPGLKQRTRQGEGGQHDAIVTWAVSGAIDWFARGMTDAPLTERVAEDTRAWRVLSDHVLRLWDEFLVKADAPPGEDVPAIVGSHLLQVFNGWLVAKGHQAWSAQTFASRFAEHTETARNGVEFRVTKRTGNLSWHPSAHRENPPGAVRAWVGLKFRLSPDLHGYTDYTSPTNSPREPSHGNYAEECNLRNRSDPPPARPSPGSPPEPAPAAPVSVTDSDEDKGADRLEAPAPRTRKSPGLAARKLTRLELDPSLAGPVHPLPVLVVRQDGSLPLVLPCSPAQALAAAEPYLGALSVDCESSGFPAGHRDWALRTVQLGGEHMAAVLDPADPAQRAVISELLARAVMLHAHSAAADLVPLAAAGLAPRDALWGKMTDSVLIAKLADPALAGSDENELKKLARDLLGDRAVSPPAEKAKNELFRAGGWLQKTTALTPAGKSGWAQVSPGCEVMARYAGSDVLDLAAVVRALPWPDERVLAREREFQAMCARVAHDGFRLDRAHITAKVAGHEAAREACRERVQRLAPAISNPSSTKEVPEALAALGVPLGLTEGGKPSAAKPELERLAADPGYEHHELLASILEYRHHVTTLGLLLEPLLVLCEHGDGRMRPVVYTINADTGRTSCVRPNGQQFSRQGGIRACVTADPGMLGISADFSGVEIRVAAALSGDPDLLRAETEGDGLHWMAARMAWGPAATKENRYAAKRIIFSKLFGGSAKAGARQTGVPHEAALAVHEAFERIAPRYAAWDREMRAYADAGNRAYRAYSGRTIWLPRGRSHAAGNYAIQGTARELLVDGVLRWGRTRWGGLPLLPIHDEILTFVPAAEAAEALEALKACMATTLLGVPIEAAADEPWVSWPDSS